MADSMSRPTNAPGQLLLDPPAETRTKARFLGVDVTRGIALIAMLAANTFEVMTDDGKPTLAVQTVTGRSATLFVMVAGISLAFLSGGRRPVQGDVRRAAAAGIVVRALLIAVVIGLSLGYFAGDLTVILPYYGLLFLLAIPLLGLRPRTLVCIAGALVVVSPLILLASYKLGMDAAFDGSLTLSSPFTNPIGFVTQLLVAGDFPLIVYMAYICVGLAIGRLDLSSTKVAARLLGGGLVLAVTTWFTSSLILFHLGGLQHLQAAGAGAGAPSLATIKDTILWNPEPVASWWWLASRGHHSGTPIDMLHTIGCAIAVLGAVLLLTKLPAARRVLWPVGVAGAMTLTIYSAHAMVLNNFGLADNNDLAFYLVQVGAAIVFALVWRRFRGQGPLERLVAEASGRTRKAAARRLRDSRDRAPRRVPVGEIQ